MATRQPLVNLQVPLRRGAAAEFSDAGLWQCRAITKKRPPPAADFLHRNRRPVPASAKTGEIHA